MLRLGAALAICIVLGCAAPQPVPANAASRAGSPDPTERSRAAPQTGGSKADEPLPLLEPARDANPPQLGALGDFQLESGEVLRDCRVEYRTVGRIDAARSNVVVWPTWFSGVTGDLLSLIGPGKLIDSSKYHVVLVGALANGVSSSPSNSPAQPRMRFPDITIGDMVKSQHQLLTRVLGFAHVRAVMGISMGGMQAFEWGVAHPDFMDRLIPIVGSPRLGAYDLLLWQASLDAIERDPEFLGGNYRTQPLLPVVQQLAELTLTTPQHYNRKLPPERAAEARSGLAPPRFDANDRVRQLRAMMRHDISKRFGGSLAGAAAALRAKLLVIVNQHDHMVTPESSLELGKLARAETLELTGACGHKAPDCETAVMGAKIGTFLE